MKVILEVHTQNPYNVVAEGTKLSLGYDLTQSGVLISNLNIEVTEVEGCECIYFLFFTDSQPYPYLFPM